MLGSFGIEVERLRVELAREGDSFVLRDVQRAGLGFLADGDVFEVAQGMLLIVIAAKAAAMSFPRKRESRLSAAALHESWIPAFAGMTGSG